LSSVRLPDVSKPLVELVQSAVERPLGFEIPSEDVGFSYAISGGAVRCFTLYSYAASLVGPDLAIRRAVLRVAARYGWDSEPYEAVTRPLETARHSYAEHGMIGFYADAKGRLGFTIGFAAPEST
jgi:hypothetical protein